MPQSPQTPKTPKTPNAKTPKSPRTPKTPKTPRTPETRKTATKTGSAIAPQVRAQFEGLDKDHRDFLRARLPEYLAFREQLKATAVGDRLVKNTKGQQQEWVISNIVPAFLAEFQLAAGDGPVLQTVKQKVCKWYWNNCKSKAGKKPSKDTASSKRPRACPPAQLFGKENKEKILKRMAEDREGEVVDTKSNLPLYQKTQKALFDALPRTERNNYKKRAAELKATILTGPSSSHLSETRTMMPQKISSALRALCGNGWEQLGDVAFFVLGAFRNENDAIKISQVSISPNPEADFINQYLGDSTENLLKPFKKWVDGVLPRTQKPVSPEEGSRPKGNPAVIVNEDGVPMLSNIDLNDMGPKSASAILGAYITAAWEFCWSPKPPPIAIPWEGLRDAEKRKGLLKNAPTFRKFKSLDPAHIGISELYDVLNFIAEEQNGEECLLQFNREAFKLSNSRSSRKHGSRHVILSSDDSNDEITEIVNPQIASRHSSQSKSPDDSAGSVYPAAKGVNGAAYPGLLPYKTVEIALLEVARYERAKQKETYSGAVSSPKGSKTATTAPSPSNVQKTITPSSSPSKPREVITSAPASSPSKARKTTTTASSPLDVRKTITPASSPSKVLKTVISASSDPKVQNANRPVSSPSKYSGTKKVTLMVPSPSKRRREEDISQEKSGEPALKRPRVEKSRSLDASVTAQERRAPVAVPAARASTRIRDPKYVNTGLASINLGRRTKK